MHLWAFAQQRLQQQRFATPVTGVFYVHNAHTKVTFYSTVSCCTCRRIAERELNSALGAISDLSEGSCNAPSDLLGPSGVRGRDLSSSAGLHEYCTSALQLHVEADSLAASNAAARVRDIASSDAKQALLDRHPLAPACAKSRVLRLWAALEGETSTGRPESIEYGATDRSSAVGLRSASTSANGTGAPNCISAGSPKTVEQSDVSCGSRTRSAGGSDGAGSCLSESPASPVSSSSAEEAAIRCCLARRRRQDDDVWSAEEDAWVAHAMWMGALEGQAAARQAARHMLALLLPARSAAELGARWRWCGHRELDSGKLSLL